MGTIKLKKATTLIEIIVSLLIISVSVVGVTATFFWMQGRNVIAQRHLQAIDFARETLEELLQKDYNIDPALATPPVNHTTEAFLDLPASTLKDKFAAVRSYSVNSIPEGKQVIITVSWNEEGQASKEELCGLVIQK